MVSQSLMHSHMGLQLCCHKRMLIPTLLCTLEGERAKISSLWASKVMGHAIPPQVQMLHGETQAIQEIK